MPKTTHIKEFIGEIYFSLDYNTFAIAIVLISYINHTYFTRTNVNISLKSSFLFFHISYKSVLSSKNFDHMQQWMLSKKKGLYLSTGINLNHLVSSLRAKFLHILYLIFRVIYDALLASSILKNDLIPYLATLCWIIFGTWCWV